MTFSPTTRDLELIASLAHARAPVARIAAAIGISELEYSAWCQRLALGRAWREPLVISARPERRLPERLRVRADRLFEQASAPAQEDEGEIAEAASRYYSVAS